MSTPRLGRDPILLFTYRKHRDEEDVTLNRLQEVKSNPKSLNRQPQEVVRVTHKRWSFMRGGRTWKFQL